MCQLGFAKLFLALGAIFLSSNANSSPDECHNNRDALIAAEAQLIAIGTIEKRNYKEDGVTYGGHIYAEMELRIEESIKGSPQRDVIRILSPGGVLTNGQTGVTRVSGVGNFDFSSNTVGDRVLVFLTYDASFQAYRVVRYYFKLINHVVVDGSSFQEPFLLDGPVTEERLKETVKSLVACTSLEQLIRGAHVVVIGSFLHEDKDFDPEKPGWGRLKTVHVEEVLKGTIQHPTLQVVVYPFDRVRWQSPKKMVLFLRRTGADHFELLHRFAGRYELSGDAAKGEGQSFSTAEFRALIEKGVR